jgi:hypothetical protein
LAVGLSISFPQIAGTDGTNGIIDVDLGDIEAMAGHMTGRAEDVTKLGSVLLTETDELDDCLGMANPSQADSDGDGIGQGCDADDDNDGRQGFLESGMGSSDTCATCTPEHWAFSDEAGCSDGVDNDLDGFSDAEDQSCHAPVPASTLPQTVAPGVPYPLYLRRDLGGVADVFDALPIAGEFALDTDFDGEADETSLFQGVVVMRRGDLGDDDRNGRLPWPNSWAVSWQSPLCASTCRSSCTMAD